jgi:hydrophobe/amphiphile efflux-3 (HAE3) family protein
MGGLPALFERVGGWLSRHPVVALVAALALVGVAVGGTAGLTSVTGDRAFVGPTPTLTDYEQSFDRGTVAVLVDGDPTEPQTMRAIDRFDRRMTGVSDVETVLSPADQVRREYGSIPDSQARIEQVVDDETTVVRVVMTPDLTQEEQAPVYDEAVAARDWAAFPAGVSVTVTGQPAFDAQTNELIGSSTRQLLGLAAGLMIVALFFLFRGVRLRLLPIVAVLMGVLYTFGAMGYLGLPNNTLTSAVFPILVGLGIDYSVQFHQRYEEELARAPPREALPRAARGIGPPVLVAMLAAAMGFAATWISASELPAFVWFAQTSVVGIMLTYLTATIVLVPTLTVYHRWRGDTETDSTPDRATPATDGDDVGPFGRALGRAARATARRPGTVLIVSGLLLSSGLYASTTLDVVADTEEFVPDDLPALLDLQQFRAQTGGGSDVQYPVLVSGGHHYDPVTLRWMDQFERAATAQPQVVSVDTPADAVRRHNGGLLPASEAGVRRAVERMSDAERQRYFANGHAQIVVVGQPDMSPQQLISFGDNVRTAVEVSRPPPGVDAELTGTSVASARLNYGQIVERNTITLLGGAFVFGLLLLYYYRTPVRAFAPMVPMTFVVGWQGLYMGALDIDVSPIGASLGALTIGIGAEYTVIVMERYYEEKAAGAAPLDAVETAASRVGKAITVSGLTTVFGFSALLLSPFPIVSDFGFLTVGVVFLTLVAALLVMPPTLVTLDAIAADLRRWWDARGAEALTSG